MRSTGGGVFDILGGDVEKVDDDDNDILLNYDPFPIRPKNVAFTEVRSPSQNNNGNKLKSDSYTNAGLEREAGGSIRRSSVVIPNVREVMSAQPSEPRGSTFNIDRVKDIASNSREVRLVGPNQKPVEMSDDLPTKFIVAMDNLKKEASDVWGQVNEKLDKGWTELKRSEVWDQVNDKLDKGWTDLKRSEVWGQVNDKLDKGWTDLKSMVEGVVAPKKKEN